jgi:hypothetical protein
MTIPDEVIRTENIGQHEEGTVVAETDTRSNRDKN